MWSKCIYQSRECSRAAAMEEASYYMSVLDIDEEGDLFFGLKR